MGSKRSGHGGGPGDDDDGDGDDGDGDDSSESSSSDSDDDVGPDQDDDGDDDDDGVLGLNDVTGLGPASVSGAIMAGMSLDNRLAPSALKVVKLHGGFLKWHDKQTWNNARNKRESHFLAQTLDVLIEEGQVTKKSLAFELLVRRLFGLGTADKTGNWDVVNVLQGLGPEYDLVPYNKLYKIMKKVNKMKKVKGKASSSSSSSSARSTYQQHNSEDGDRPKYGRRNYNSFGRRDGKSSGGDGKLFGSSGSSSGSSSGKSASGASSTGGARQQ